MSVLPDWKPVEADVDRILTRYPSPLKDLANGNVPAFIIRQAFNPQHCIRLVERFYERGLLYNPHDKAPDKPIRRVDIGTSFGSHRSDPDKFFKHARQTHGLYSTLFDGYDNPITLIFEILSALAPDKKVVVAREPDGRLYGPGIFRTYYEGVGHTPHFDSVRKRSKATAYQIARFDKQFAGVLCFQNAEDDGENGQAHLYRQQWRPDLQPYLSTFKNYAQQHQIDRIKIELNPGDFYIFCSETIHEVPPPCGDRPRIVLAVFFAMSDDDEEIYVWS